MLEILILQRKMKVPRDGKVIDVLKVFVLFRKLKGFE